MGMRIIVLNGSNKILGTQPRDTSSPKQIQKVALELLNEGIKFPWTGYPRHAIGRPCTPKTAGPTMCSYVFICFYMFLNVKSVDQKIMSV